MTRFAIPPYNLKERVLYHVCWGYGRKSYRNLSMRWLTMTEDLLFFAKIVWYL